MKEINGRINNTDISDSNSILISTNKILEYFVPKKYKFNTTSIMKINANIRQDNNIIKKCNIKIFRFNKRKCLFYNLFLTSFIALFFKLNFENIIISNNSFITLKVSQIGTQKIFGDGDSFTKPNEIWIDDIKQNNVINSHNLNPTNIVKLVWTNTITNCTCMFFGCDSIIEINFTNFYAIQCENTDSMFMNCSSLISLDLSGFITSNNLIRMANMFWNCYSLISLNLSNFDTSNVISLGHIFCNCKSLKSLDISNFKTDKNRKFDNIFNGCISLTSINLTNFNTSQMENMDNMFESCESLRIIDFSNLDLTKITNIESLDNAFLNCKNLEYINIKNLKSNINLESKFFNGIQKILTICVEPDNSQLIYNSIGDNICFLVNCVDNWTDYKYKINTENYSCIENCTNVNYKYEYNNKCYPECLSGTFNNNYICEDCHSDCKECEGAYTEDNSNCKTCISNEKFLYFGNCINNCTKNFYINETTNQKTCKCQLEQCMVCSLESLSNNLCTICETESGYYPIYNYFNNNQFLNCSISPEGYYLDNEKSIYKLCYLSCKICDSSGNESIHNCIECKNNYNYELIIGEYKNCYDECPYYHYFDENQNKYYCTNNKECPKNYIYLIEDKKECIINCNKYELYKYEFRKKCFQQCPINSHNRENSDELEGYSLDKKYFCKPICNDTFPLEILDTQECVNYCDIPNILNNSCIINYQGKDEKDKVKLFDILLKKTEEIFISPNYNTSDIEYGNNEIIKYKQMTITLTSTRNQKNDENNPNISSINLGDCERILKEVYNIPQNKSLFMKKIESIEEGMKIPKIEFDIYYRLNQTNLTKLNLSFCGNIKIDISVPTKLTEDLERLNSSSDYYNNLCYKAKSDYGTDIILKDRKKEFIENNKTVCQENCFFSKYDYNTSKAKCSCDIVESSSSFANIKIDKSKLLKNFLDIRNIANINLLACYKILFSKKGIIKNYGSYSIMAIITMHFIIIIIFYMKNLNKTIRKVFNKIKLHIEILKYSKKDRNKAQLNKMKYEEKDKKSNKKQMINHKKPENKIIKKSSQLNLLNYLNNNQKKRKDVINHNSKNQVKEINIYSKNKNRVYKNSNSIKSKDKIINYKENILNYNDEELNNLGYKLALKNDKRNYCQYYFSLLKTKHILIFTFFNNEDYNSKIIKIDLFLFNFSLFFMINALFFNDDTIHKIYENNGIFDIIDQFPEIIYSSFISMLLSSFLELLALTEGILLKLKRIKSKIDFNKRIIRITKVIKIKFLLYFIISTIFLIFFWYYLSMFCAIYENTQIHLIKDTLLSFLSSLIEPLGFYFIPGLFRIPSLSKHNKYRYILYRLSKIIQMII